MFHTKQDADRSAAESKQTLRPMQIKRGVSDTPSVMRPLLSHRIRANTAWPSTRHDPPTSQKKSSPRASIPASQSRKGPFSVRMRRPRPQASQPIAHSSSITATRLRLQSF